MAKKEGFIEPKSLAEFNATMEKFSKAMGTNVEMITREQIRLMCRDAMTFTPPMPKGGGQGLSVKAHKAGMNKLGNDVRRIFVPADSPRKAMPVVLRQVINSVRANDQEGFRTIYDRKSTLSRIDHLSPVMRKILQDSSYTRAFAKAKNYLAKANIYGQIRPIAGTVQDPRPIHDKYKNAVNGRWKKNQPVGGPQYFIDSTQALNAYIAERQLKVGRVKAGWAMAQSLVPLPVNKNGKAYNRGVYNAPWVDSNRSSMGQFTAMRSGQKVSMTVLNMIGNINAVADDADTKNIVYGNRVKQMELAILQKTNPTVYEANRKK